MSITVNDSGGQTVTALGTVSAANVFTPIYTPAAGKRVMFNLVVNNSTTYEAVVKVGYYFNSDPSTYIWIQSTQTSDSDPLSLVPFAPDHFFTWQNKLMKSGVTFGIMSDKVGVSVDFGGFINDDQ